MNTREMIAVGLAFGALIGCAWSRPVDLSAPSGGLGVANPKGYLEIWREIDAVGIQLGNSYLPFRYKFSSDPSLGGILGPGFYVPMFESRNTLVREDTMRINLPCGKVLYMWHTASDTNKFESVDKEWTGYLMGNDFVVWRDDGWKIFYHNNRLISITTDDDQLFNWNYYSSGLPESITENGKTLISVESNSGGQISAFVFNGKRYEVGYAERPITEMLLGQVAIKELDQALSTFKYPDGSADTFKFILTPDRIPTLTFASRDQKQTVYSLDPTTEYIKSEDGPSGNWTYKIGQVTQAYGAPPISRSSDKGEIEGIDIDTKMGTYTVWGSDGVTTVTHVFKTPGPLYDKVQKIEEIRKINGKDVSTQIMRASYDEAGRLIREVNAKGYITTVTYGTGQRITSRSTSLPIDPQLLAAVKEKGRQLVTLVASAKTEADRQDALRSLAQYYMFDMLDPAKTASLLPQLDHQHAFVIRLQQMDIEPSLADSEKVNTYKDLLREYPEYKQRLEFLIKHYERKTE